MVNRWPLAAKFSILLLAVAVIAGGGGVTAPSPELFVELAACLLLAVASFMLPVRTRQPDRAGWGVVALIAALPALQLVPLPFALWSALPGRELARTVMTAIGEELPWRPLSLFPDQTFASLLSLVPPLAAMFLVSRLRLRDRMSVVGAVGVLAALGGMVGIVQFVGGNARWLRFYTHTHYGFATGFFANRNAQADLMLVGLVAVLAVVAERQVTSRPLARLGSGIFVALFVASVIATGSRMGTVLLIIPAIAALHLFAVISPRRLSGRQLAVGAGVLAAGALATLCALQLTALSSTWDRFRLGTDGRETIWANTAYAIGQYWPAGAGFGSFVPVYAVSEPLTDVSATYVNRAHNDWMEMALEGGVGTILVMVAVAALVIARVTARLRAADRLARIQGCYVLYSVIIIALHSLVDYPLRTLALAVVSASSVGLLLNGESKHRPQSD